MKLALFTALTVLAFAKIANAADVPAASPQAPGVNSMLVPSGHEAASSEHEATPQAVGIPCNTGQIGCHGKAVWGAFPTAQACRIWKNDGQSGFTNFTLNSGQTVIYLVGYRDSTACRDIKYGPPVYEGQRYWILVTQPGG